MFGAIFMVCYDKFSELEKEKVTFFTLLSHELFLLYECFFVWTLLLSQKRKWSQLINMEKNELCIALFTSSF